MTTDLPRCNRCRRVLSDPRWCAVGLGRVCAARLGLVLRSQRLVRARAPVRAGGGVEVPVLDGLNELMEIEESED